MKTLHIPWYQTKRIITGSSWRYRLGIHLINQHPEYLEWKSRWNFDNLPRAERSVWTKGHKIHYKTHGFAKAIQDPKAPTAADFDRWLEKCFRTPRKPGPRVWPCERVDYDLLVKHRIAMFQDLDGMWLTSSTEMRRAFACGAICYEDSTGRRVLPTE